MGKCALPSHYSSPAALKGRPAAEQLKEKFAKTMGSARGFEFRREELALLDKKALTEISDEKVVESFLKELGPGGNFEKFLEQGQLMHRIGKADIQRLPWKKSPAAATPHPAPKSRPRRFNTPPAKYRVALGK